MVPIRHILPLLLIFFGATPVYADVALLLHQPHGTFGFFNPTGHASLYLSRVCAESPVRLRLCNAGETGVVISRYNKIAGYDWLAIPLIPFMYAVDTPEQVPDYIDNAGVMAFRDAWRRKYLRDIAPDAPNTSGASAASSNSADYADYENGAIPKGDWTQLVGAAYDRKIYGFVIETSIDDDEALIEMLNSRDNRRSFNLLFNNCADFAKNIINFYYPKSVRRNIIADIGISSPKLISKALVKFSKRNPNLRFSVFMIPQVDGELERSKVARGVIETLILSKKYVVPLVILSPWGVASGVVAYVVGGRFDPEKHVSAILHTVELKEYLSANSEYVH